MIINSVVEKYRDENKPFNFNHNLFMVHRLNIIIYEFIMVAGVLKKYFSEETNDSIHVENNASPFYFSFCKTFNFENSYSILKKSLNPSLRIS